MQREIQVIANSQNRSEIIMSDASTLGELKNELREKGYTVDGMDFKEGKSRTELRDDLSVLPSHFMYRGQETSDLVIMISPKNTKITSGVGSERAHAYAQIKEKGLQSFFADKYGRSFTNLPTEVLVKELAAHTSGNSQPEAPEAPKGANCGSHMDESTVRKIANEEIDKREGEYSLSSLALCILKVINFLEEVRFGHFNLVSHETCEHWRKAIKKGYSQYTAEELAEMDY